MLTDGALHRPRVSRETRRLLGAAGLALVALWVLARLRFPDTPVVANPVPPLLAQLAPPARFPELATEIATVAARVRDAMTVISLGSPAGDGPYVALRVRPGLAAAVAATSALPPGPLAPSITAADRATGLLLATMPGEAATLPPSWAPTDPGDPEFLLTTLPTPDGGVALSPVFVSSLTAHDSAAWQATTWRLTPDTTLMPGAFVFSTAGELAGVVADDAGTLTLVPPATLLGAVDALVRTPRTAPPGWIGIEATGITASLARATGVDHGVVVTHVDARAPLASSVHAGDVITAVNGTPIESEARWFAFVLRVRAGEQLQLRVEGGGAARDLALTAPAFPAASARTLGARFQHTAAGARVVSVEPGSAAAAAGLEAGDLITRTGDTPAPTPAQVERAFTSMAPGGNLLVAFTRGTAYHVVALER